MAARAGAVGVGAAAVMVVMVAVAFGEQTEARDKEGQFIQGDSKVPLHIFKPFDNIAI